MASIWSTAENGRPIPAARARRALQHLTRDRPPCRSSSVPSRPVAASRSPGRRGGRRLAGPALHLPRDCPLLPCHRPSRWDAIDVARGIAIAAMIAYHFFWDLSFLQLIAIGDRRASRPGTWFARSIAGSFLALAGIGLALAHAEGFRRRAFLIRLVKVGGRGPCGHRSRRFSRFPKATSSSASCTAIAVGSVLALPFLRAPLWLVLAAAAACFAAPHLFQEPRFRPSAPRLARPRIP